MLGEDIWIAVKLPGEYHGDYEYAGALPEALAALTGGCADSREDIEEAEEVFGDVVRLAIAAGDLAGARAFAGQAATLAAGSEVPHRQATALYCRGLLDGDAPCCSRPRSGMRTPAGR